MPKVKKIYAVGGNPVLAAKLLLKTAPSVANILRDDSLKETYNNITKNNPEILTQLKAQFSEGDIKGLISTIESNESTKPFLNNANVVKLVDIAQQMPTASVLKFVNTIKKIVPELNDNKGLEDLTKDNKDLEDFVKGFTGNKGLGDLTKGLGDYTDGQSGVNKESILATDENVTDYTPGISSLKNIPRSNVNLNLSAHPDIEDNDPSFYIIFAIALKGILRYIWDLFVMSVKSSYRLFTDLILIPFFIFLPYVFDVLAVILVLVFLILIIIYFVSGGKKRQSNNMFDNMLGGFSMFLMPNITGYVKDAADDFKDDFTADAKSFTGGVMGTLNNIGDVINDTIFKTFLRFFISNPGIDDINDNDKQQRIQKKEGRCDNKIQIESKDGRYCYEQLDKKHIEWDNKEIPYKLLEQKDMKNKGKNNHFDYYIPNCKGSNIFTKEYIASCKDSRRTKFICKI
tara:strand:+ start:563 stop:1936 length:1374 start_codon:yes stop_codon:yes gene_type:complete